MFAIVLLALDKARLAKSPTVLCLFCYVAKIAALECEKCTLFPPPHCDHFEGNIIGIPYVLKLSIASTGSMYIGTHSSFTSLS